MFIKITWFSVDNEKLDWKNYDREEVLSYDKHAMGVFRKNATLAGYIPIELSNLIDYFLTDAKENFASTAVVLPRKHEVGLVVPAKFTAVTKKLNGSNCSAERNFKAKILIFN